MTRGGEEGRGTGQTFQNDALARQGGRQPHRSSTGLGPGPAAARPPMPTPTPHSGELGPALWGWGRGEMPPPTRAHMQGLAS